MKPNTSQNSYSEMKDSVEKKKWISPEIDVHDIVEITQSGVQISPNLDGDFSYS